MARWIAFDQATYDALGTHLPAPATAAPGEGFPLDAALAAAPALALLPGPQPDEVLYVEIRRPGAAESEPEAAHSYVAGGFLGLIDEPVYEEELPPKKRRRG